MATIEPLDAAGAAEALEALAELLHACVHAGASVNFVLPFPMQEARAFWRDKALPAVARGQRRLLVARSGGRIVGSVQLDLATPPNQAHRGDVAKLLVHPDARRQGIARALMIALEALAAREGRWLLTLDTVTGAAAEPLYLSLGFEIAGRIPDYALAPDASRFEATTVMFKLLDKPP